MNIDIELLRNIGLAFWFSIPLTWLIAMHLQDKKYEKMRKNGEEF